MSRFDVDDDEMDFIIAINGVATQVFNIQFVLAIIGVGLNIPHLIISCHKLMRTNSTTILIITIALCDLIVLSEIIRERARAIYIKLEANCVNGNTYAFHLITWITNFLEETSTRSSNWLGVFLALLRLLIIMLPFRAPILSRPLLGVYLSLAIYFVHSCLSANYHLRWEITKQGNYWRPWSNCEGFPENYTEVAYYKTLMKNQDDILSWYTMIRAVSQILITLLYPLLAMCLIFAMRRSRKSARIVSSERSNETTRTTRFILVMTTGYVFSTAPVGVSNFLQHIHQPTDSGKWTLLLAYSTVFLNILFVINSASHCMVCYTMSTQYRKAARMVFGRKGRPTSALLVSTLKTS